MRVILDFRYGHKRNVHRFNSTKSFGQDCNRFSSGNCHMNDLCIKLLRCGVSGVFLCLFKKKIKLPNST